MRGLAQMLDLSDAQKQGLLVSSNLAMQTLDEQGLSPYRTFDSISKFAELLARSKGERFVPRISTYTITENTQITLIEPSCGSNTAIVKSFGKILCIDSVGRDLLGAMSRVIAQQTNKVYSAIKTIVNDISEFLGVD